MNKSNLNLDLDLVSFLDPIVCKVEVDIAGWLYDLSGGDGWKLHSEQENENILVSF